MPFIWDIKLKAKKKKEKKRNHVLLFPLDKGHVLANWAFLYFFVKFLSTNHNYPPVLKVAYTSGPIFEKIMKR